MQIDLLRGWFEKVGEGPGFQEPAAMAMKKISSSCFVMILATFFVVFDCEARPARNVQSILKPRVIKYYVHDDLLQKVNNTAFIIAGRGGNVSALEQFSLIAMNDLITEEPSVSSRKLGNAQGVYLVSEFFPSSPHIHQQFTAVFKDKYNGTIAYQGDDQVMIPVREIAVVGGTGEFRNAFGYCFITTVKQTDAWSYSLAFETHLWTHDLGRDDR